MCFESGNPLESDVNTKATTLAPPGIYLRLLRAHGRPNEHSSRVQRGDREDEIAILANERPRGPLQKLFDHHSSMGLDA